MHYPDLLNPDLLDRIPLHAHVVLDVGCGSGALGAEYKRRNPMACVMGIEHDKAAARVAAARLDKVFMVDLDGDLSSLDKEIGKGTVDCIVYGDVLEHLRDPWSVLKQQSSWLAEDGTVLFCIPNAENWAFVERLLRGTWDYEEQGLFDGTHLRWFTADTTRRALQRAGLIPVDVIPRTFDSAASEAFVDAITPSLERLGVDRDDYLRRAAPIQHVWRAMRKRPVRPLPLVSTMLNPVGGVSHVRVLEPMHALATDPSFKTSIIGNVDPRPNFSGDPGIFIFHRPLLAGEPGLARIRALLQEGWLVLCEFDDHPDYIPVLQRPDVYNFRGVHAVQTSTEPLAEVLRQHNSEVMVFPNAITRLADVKNFGSTERRTIFFAGLNRENEWPPYIAALNSVASRVGGRLHFQIVNDRGLFDALRTPHKTFVPLCDYETYLAILGSCDISFMPLLDTPFNRCKSDLKFIELAARRVVSLASDVVYGDIIDDGRTGVLFRNQDELERRLYRLVVDPAVGPGIGEAARSYVAQNRMLAYQVSRRSEWYNSLWARREQLKRDLLLRVPELGIPTYNTSPNVRLEIERRTVTSAKL